MGLIPSYAHDIRKTVRRLLVIDCINVSDKRQIRLSQCRLPFQLAHVASNRRRADCYVRRFRE